MHHFLRILHKLNPFHRLNRKLDNLNHKLEIIMSQQDAAAEQLNTVSDTLTKVSAETSTLLALIQELKDAAGNDTVSPALQAAIDKVAEQASAIDALVPDAPAPTP